MQHKVHPSARERNNKRGDKGRKETAENTGFHEDQRRRSGAPTAGREPSLLGIPWIVVFGVRIMGGQA